MPRLKGASVRPRSRFAGVGSMRARSLPNSDGECRPRARMSMVAPADPRDALIPAWVQGSMICRQTLCGVSRIGAGSHRCHVYQCPGPLNRQREGTVVLIIQAPGAGAAACWRRRRAGDRLSARSSGAMACSSRGRARAICSASSSSRAARARSVAATRCGLTRWLVGRDHGLEWRGGSHWLGGSRQARSSRILAGVGRVEGSLARHAATTSRI